MVLDKKKYNKHDTIFYFYSSEKFLVGKTFFRDAAEFLSLIT